MVIKMKINDLIKNFGIETDIPDSLKEHEVGMVMPPANQYEYHKENEKHIFSKKTGKITDTITIDESEKKIIFEKESIGLPTAGYVIHEDGTEDLM